MEILHEIGILEMVAATLAAVIMLGPLVPYAIYGHRSRRKN
jgi:hypothetical protein